MGATDKPKVVLTRRWPQAVETELAQHYNLVTNPTDEPFDVAAMRQALQQADALCPTVTDTIPAELFDEPQRCRLLANFGVGYNHIPLAAAQGRGLMVTNTPDVLTDCTADLALLLLLMAARRAGEGERELRANAWTGWRPTHLMGTAVTGKTLGIVGMGRIGQALARRAGLGFGMRIMYHNRHPLPTATLAPLRSGAAPIQYFAELEAMLPHCDFLSLHCPATPATAQLMNAARLALLPEHAYLINTARGEVVDEAALVAALDAGALRGAGLDVYQGEPEVNPKLLQRRDVVLLPHLGSATRETRTAMGQRVAANLKAFFAGAQPPDQLPLL